MQQNERLNKVWRTMQGFDVLKVKKRRLWKDMKEHLESRSIKIEGVTSE